MPKKREVDQATGEIVFESGRVDLFEAEKSCAARTGLTVIRAFRSETVWSDNSSEAERAIQTSLGVENAFNFFI